MCHGLQIATRQHRCCSITGISPQKTFQPMLNSLFFAIKGTYCKCHNEMGRFQLIFRGNRLNIIIQYYSSKNLISLASTSGDNEVQQQIFELILWNYANKIFDSKTKPLIIELFKTVKFDYIEWLLFSYNEESSQYVRCTLHFVVFAHNF